MNMKCGKEIIKSILYIQLVAYSPLLLPDQFFRVAKQDCFYAIISKG